jgi:mannitol-1-phosphate/altronate dehydrogenase
MVDAVRMNGGSYYVNVARSDSIESLRIDNVELLNPTDAKDRDALLEVLSQSTEMATCLPSVNFYESGGPGSVASLIAESLRKSHAGAAIIYAAENNNRAAEILQEAVARRAGPSLPKNVQFLNTVIGKMSRVVTDSSEIAELKLKTVAPGIERAFLVEEFNRILVSRTEIGGFKPGVDLFIEKDDLLPFEEAKLYGHNAIHSVLGFIGAMMGVSSMTELRGHTGAMQIGRDAFLLESGAALVQKYSRLGDELFTQAGFRAYAEDLLERMTSPYLGDTVARVTRDIVRKLEIDGRIFGTMQLALEYSIEPKNMAVGALAGIAMLGQQADQYRVPDDVRLGNWRQPDAAQLSRLLKWLWKGQTCKYVPQFIECIRNAADRLDTLVVR